MVKGGTNQRPAIGANHVLQIVCPYLQDITFAEFCQAQRYGGNAQRFPGEYEGCPLEESPFPYLVDSAELLRYPSGGSETRRPRRRLIASTHMPQAPRALRQTIEEDDPAFCP
jgi:hypothetical protein